jgi:dual-specificity kinase
MRYVLVLSPLIPLLTNVIIVQAAKRLVPCDDKEGHYIIIPDDIIYDRCAYSIIRSPLSSCTWADARDTDRVVRLLGQGTFGKVVEAVDMHTQKRVAIKIIRAIPKYRDASKIEVRVLTKLKDRDPMNRQYVIPSYRQPSS